MNKRDEKKLSALLTKMYGDKWEFWWEGQDDGFSLTLEVWHKAKEEK